MLATSRLVVVGSALLAGFVGFVSGLAAPPRPAQADGPVLADYGTQRPAPSKAADAPTAVAGESSRPAAAASAPARLALRPDPPAPPAPAIAEPEPVGPPPPERPDGPVALRDAAGRLEAQGAYRAGRPHGSWTRWYRNESSSLAREAQDTGFELPLRAELTLEAGVLEGACAVFDGQGRLVAVFSLRGGLPEGRCVWRTPEGGPLRVAEYRGGRLHGPLTARHAGRETTNQFVDGRRLDRYLTRRGGEHPDVEGWILAALPVEEHRLEWWSGDWRTQVVERPSEPLRHGRWVWRYASGQRQAIGQFERGREQGHWIVWHPSGLKQLEGDYRDGRPIGLWQRWDDHGQLLASEEFSLPEPDTSRPVLATHLEPARDPPPSHFQR